MKKWAFLLLAVLTCSLPLCGCGSSPSSSADTSSIVIMEIVSPTATTWDSKTGLELRLKPQDLHGKVVPAPGTIDAKLYISVLLKPTEKEDLVQSWTGIKVSAGDFDANSGALIRLDYRNYAPEVVQHGILDITLDTTDGRRLTATASDIVLKR